MVHHTTKCIAIVSTVFVLCAGCARVHASPAAKDNAELAVTQLVKSARSWDGALLPAYPTGQPEVTMLKIGIPAGARLEMHSHPVINVGLLTKGALTVITTEGKTLHLKAGDPIVEIVNTLHYGINEGAEPAEIIVWYAGAEGSPITVKEK